MKRLPGISIACMLLAVCVLSCSRKAKVIPRDEMVDIYVEMFLADQWLNYNHDARAAADTTSFYEPIFLKYGYTSRDFVASMDEYLYDPLRYSRMLKKVSTRIDQRLKKLNAYKAYLDEINASMRSGTAYRQEFHAYYDTYYMQKLDKRNINFVLDSMGRYQPALIPPDTTENKQPPLL